MSENDIIHTPQNVILTIRQMQVMIDTDLAQLYGVETKALNQAVKRNILRFPEAFRFQLTEAEKRELVTNCDRFNHLKHSTTAPYAFTEQGVAMLSAVLRSDTAVKVSIQIMQAFVSMRRLLALGQGIAEHYGAGSGGAEMTAQLQEQTPLSPPYFAGGKLKALSPLWNRGEASAAKQGGGFNLAGVGYE